METPHTNNQHNPDAERLSDILSRVGKFVDAHHPEPTPTQTTRQPEPVTNEQSSLPLGVPNAALPIPPEYIRAEAFLETSGYFTPASNRIENIYTKEKKIKEYIDDQGKKKILRTKITANHEYGLPITSDLDYYRAFLKLCDDMVDRDGRFRMPIAVPSFKLARYAGKKWSDKTHKEIREWLRRMNFTGIEGAIYRAKKKTYDDSFSGVVFSQTALRGETMKNGKIADTNYVWLAPWFLSNYYYRYTRPVDFAFYKQLRKPIAKSLYTLLENGWYAGDGRPYSKSYQALCDEFLMQKFTHLSRIKQQLDPSHAELQKLQLIETWEYHKTANGSDYIITYYPGQKFFYDQKAKVARRDLSEQIETGKQPEPPQPPQPSLLDHHQMILADILSMCGDINNEPSYRKIVATYSEPLIRMALSETRQAHLEGRILKTRGAYFTDTLKRLHQLHEQRGTV